MKPRVLLVDNAVHRFLFKPSWHWKAHLHGIATETVNLPSARRAPNLGGFTHIILTGSEASILEPKPWFQVEAALVRDAVAAGIPLLGSCFGHQMLVCALSGSDFVAASEPPEVGWTKIEMTKEDPLFEGLPNPWQTFVYHFDEVTEPPLPWIKLGRTTHCDTHVLRYGDAPVWGIQAHPEISSRKARFFIRATLLMGRKSPRHLLKALRQAPPHNDVAKRVLQRFLSHGTP